MDNKPLKPEEYKEPRCLLIDETDGKPENVTPVPQQRIIEKMDEYMSRRDYAGAERHLLYWLEEAKLGRDQRGELMIRNELVGHYRKVGNKEKAFENMEKALELLDVLDYHGSISSGTTFVNCATACNAFGENERAIELFEKAKKVYESVPSTRSELLGGLYNNMALTYVSLGDYAAADRLYSKALTEMAKVKNGELEQAITYLNMANRVEAEKGLEAGEGEINALLDKAYDLLNSPDVDRNGYYAFVLEKCAPTFSYYGYFLAAEEFTRVSQAIYTGEKPAHD